MAESIPQALVKQADPDLKFFVAISAALTGYSEIELAGTGMVDDYFCVLMKEQDHEGVRAFFDKVEELLKKPATLGSQIKEAFIDLPPSASGLNPSFDQLSYKGLAQRIILLWYTGVWTTMNWLDTKSQRDRTTIVSAEAYQQGLIWETAGTHPAGAKQPGFGSWQAAPIGKKDQQS